MPRIAGIKPRRGTTAEWAAANAASPSRKLADGELGYDTTTKDLVVGDGSTAFASLPRVGSHTYVRAFMPEAYGAVGDGATDDSAAVTAAIAAAYAAGGGVVQFSAKTYRINSQIVLPNDGHSTIPRQPPIRLTGAGHTSDGQWQGQGTIPGATILDLRSTTGPAKIDTRGLGTLQIDSMVLTQNGSAADTNPFIQTTNTTVLVRDVAFFGHSTLSDSSCVQDAIIFGGTTTALDGTSDAAFQGYGSEVTNCYFARIQRGAYLRAYANSIRITGNTWSRTCGAGASAAAIHLDGTSSPGQSAACNVITANCIEVTGYNYGIRLNNAKRNYCVGNQFWDADAGLVSCFFIEGSGVANVEWNRLGSAFPGVTPAKHVTLNVSGGGTVSYFLERDNGGSAQALGGFLTNSNGQATMTAYDTGRFDIGGSWSSAAYLSVMNGSNVLNIDSQGLVIPTAGQTLDLYSGSANDSVRVRRGKLTAESGLQVQFAANIWSGSGAPAIAGTAGDIYIRTGTPSTANQRIYVCTTTGAAGVAVWTGVV